MPIKCWRKNNQSYTVHAIDSRRDEKKIGREKFMHHSLSLKFIGQSRIGLVCMYQHFSANHIWKKCWCDVYENKNHVHCSLCSISFLFCSIFTWVFAVDATAASLVVHFSVWHKELKTFEMHCGIDCSVEKIILNRCYTG